jgi:hypothetical protein
MKKTSKWIVYLCWYGALGINIRLLIKSVSNNEPIFTNVVGVILLIVFILVLHFSIKNK